MEPVKSWRLADTMELVGRVQHEYHTTDPSYQPTHVFVDAIGVGGPVADRLRQLRIPAVDVNVSEDPAIGSVYHKLRDELWGEARTWFNTRKVTIPEDPELVNELIAPKLKDNHISGKLKCESKLDMLRRQIPSPDLADAFCMTFAYEGSIAAGAATGAAWNTSINESMDQSWLI